MKNVSRKNTKEPPIWVIKKIEHKKTSKREIDLAGKIGPEEKEDTEEVSTTDKRKSHAFFIPMTVAPSTQTCSYWSEKFDRDHKSKPIAPMC